MPFSLEESKGPVPRSLLLWHTGTNIGGYQSKNGWMQEVLTWEVLTSPREVLTRTREVLIGVHKDAFGSTAVECTVHGAKCLAVLAGGVPYSPSVIGPALSELRESINGVLLDVRLLSLYLNAGVFALALICGLLLGDQSRPDLPRDEREGDDGLYRTMPAARAATWDRGGPTFRGGGRGALSERSSLPPPPPAQKFVDELRPSRGAFTAVSAGLWVEFVLCVALDTLGTASYFYPLGEFFVDGGFAFAYAFAIELFFDWPAMALFGFWEEALPYTDGIPSPPPPPGLATTVTVIALLLAVTIGIPTATLAWVLTVCGVRYAMQGRTARAGVRQGKDRGTLLLVDRLAKGRGEALREKRPARWFDDQWGYLDDPAAAKGADTSPILRDRSGNALP
ncbi:hypothetical protein EMIHUDRAFT_244257 [Emiliania huxleyi CCMP1516]|uniref:Uncharacterized protein n=2 Tax=Emiliania huxleyi TaxID=2903 RepID=A0A0D3J156_EMIH1|nr:hypothetical protein EMIHUDRAFT_244257 [Emiliania huxleyi CCMP1516]EOD17241.1 hypothetical protein EMIHUDRAFT_244257 [Emiliania huxleyi CCMP1516]|eukprot:XP_005769670.1 hypothetical protein EMIHUDRAFT_244257 [Emiliania huxleyi CCMP1516]